ncbi:MAG TPA: DUF11 domain-containing protein [Gemmataceae bacterium]|nr:DUF11 domain-containing protein [Gemmataceae bacterium]
MSQKSTGSRRRVRRLGVAGLLCGLVALSAPLAGQNPFLGTPAPTLPPLLYVRFAAPSGLRVTFYRGTRAGQTLETPFVVGLRPGYIYRVEIGNIPQHPGLVLNPTLEVRGSLWVPSKMARDNPAQLIFQPEDFAAARAGSVITRIITVERPDEAIPVATQANQPLEFNAPLNRDPLEEAQRHGRPLLIVRMGQRQMSPAELAAEAIPGTVLLPGERVLPAPAAPPWIPWTCAPVADPKLGPYPPSSEICFIDGGDGGQPPGFTPEGQLRGLRPSATVAEYADSQGRRRIAISNQVCICVPRFVVTRGEMAPESNFTRVGAYDTTTAHGHSGFRSWWTTLDLAQREQLDVVASRQRASGTSNSSGTSVIGLIEGLGVVSQAVETGSVASSCPPPEATPPGERPLLLIKWPDRCATAIGEVITFFLKYTNRGGRPITNVAVSDSLTSRLEYVAGSARSDRDSVFTTQPNEAGSLTLRWEINGALPPGQTGIVSFQARVR